MIVRMLFVAVLMVGLPIVSAVSAEADCRWDWDCSRTPCRRVPICDSPLDISSPPPPEIPPLVAPSIAPIPEPVVPPVGTTTCRPTRLCDHWGQCVWQTVCR